MWVIGKKYSCSWAGFVQILHKKTNGDFVVIDNKEEVHIINPETVIFDEDRYEIRLKEVMIKIPEIEG